MLIPLHSQSHEPSEQTGTATPVTLDNASSEASRVMTVCNACRYCEGICATFQAMTKYRSFTPENLDYLANLCHNCGACYQDCQYVAPHEFNINVPRTLTELRTHSYARYAWPRRFARAFDRNGLVLAVSLSTIVSMVLLLTFGAHPSSAVQAHTGPGAFYEVISHTLMVTSAGSLFVFALYAMFRGVHDFSLAIRESRVQRTSRSWWQALKYATTMRFLAGGHGEGCPDRTGTASNARRFYHHATVWGFLLCFASTCIATFYDVVLQLEAPYPYLSLPVVFGTVGGLGLTIGCLGLAWCKYRFPPEATSKSQFGMDYGFIYLLCATAVTGLILLAARESTAMPALLAIHLGVVLTLFACMPYSKFIHGAMRFAALLKFSAEQAQPESSTPTPTPQRNQQTGTKRTSS